MVPSRPNASTGCGLISMNTWWSEPSRLADAASNSTGLRRLRHQYRASSSRWSTSSPVTVEIIGTDPGRGRISPSASSSSRSTGSTRSLCDA
jgi:hypothetical protein